jgi:hypothetical protein
MWKQRARLSTLRIRILCPCHPRSAPLANASQRMWTNKPRKSKRAVLKDVESKRAEVPGGTDRDALDTKLTEMRTSVTKAEQRLADSDAKSN